jgi:lipopolysaccharide biosynthesis glycosyltransferase
MNQPHMHIAISFDQNFITPTYVFLTSLFDNNRKHKITFHAIATGVSESEKQKISRYIHQHGASITYYSIDEKSLNSFVIPEHSYFTVATYYRLFFPGLVPTDVQQLLYIDTDTVVVGDLGSLYQINISPYPAAAALDTAVTVRPDLGIDHPGGYFNAGVLLIDINTWKQQQISEKAIQFLIDYPEKIQWVDQDALNAVLYHNVYKLDGGYNVTFYDIPQELPRSNYKNFLTNKYIIHYTTGLHKPWSMMGENKLRYIYHEYLKKSPKKSENKYKNYKTDFKSVTFFLKVRILEYLYNYPTIIRFLKKYS